MSEILLASQGPGRESALPSSEEPFRIPAVYSASSGLVHGQRFNVGDRIASELLRDLDAYYPPECTIRMVLDNHSAHLSKETRAYLATRPNRFKYVLTPTHGSWLNIVETLFGKMTRTFLRQIRVGSKKELRERILQGIGEINEMPVVHRWKKFEALEAGREGA